MLVGEDKTISFVDAPGVTLALSVAGGTQEENPAVLLRGGPGVPDHLTDVAESLARGRRVIRYDQRGTGRLINHDRHFGLFGSADIYGATKERFFARYPNARHVVLEKAGHIAWLQGPEAFRGKLCAFFDC